MNEEHIKKLIEKYNSATSSVEEEKVLFENGNEVNTSIQKLSTFIKKNKRQVPENFNDKLWDSFDKKTRKRNKFRIGLISIAASLALILSIYINKQNQNELTLSEKQVLLNEVKNMFMTSDDEEQSYKVILENELVIVYTRVE